eukprot:3048071-Prymnesium_polylepis.1
MAWSPTRCSRRRAASAPASSGASRCSSTAPAASALRCGSSSRARSSSTTGRSTATQSLQHEPGGAAVGSLAGVHYARPPCDRCVRCGRGERTALLWQGNVRRSRDGALLLHRECAARRRHQLPAAAGGHARRARICARLSAAVHPPCAAADPRDHADSVGDHLLLRDPLWCRPRADRQRRRPVPGRRGAVAARLRADPQHVPRAGEPSGAVGSVGLARAAEGPGHRAELSDIDAAGGFTGCAAVPRRGATGQQSGAVSKAGGGRDNHGAVVRGTGSSPSAHRLATRCEAGSRGSRHTTSRVVVQGTPVLPLTLPYPLVLCICDVTSDQRLYEYVEMPGWTAPKCVQRLRLHSPDPTERTIETPIGRTLSRKRRGLSDSASWSGAWRVESVLEIQL